MINSKLVFLGRKKPEYYNGILIKADTGLHAQVANTIQELVKGQKVSILDCGAGEGALASRLTDLGHSVTAIDIDEEAFRCPQAKFKKINFDDPSDFENFVKCNGNKFDVVVSTEVIEHIEDQWGYARQLRKMLKPGGHMVITTPNTASYMSRFDFLRKGQFQSFNDHGLTYGHISPITPWELNLILSRCDLENVTVKPAGTLPPLYLVPTREVIKCIIMLFVRPFIRGPINGWCTMATAQKSMVDK
jgi:SAM-dependent methyltransferase